ncbi:conserved hypothetical protein [Rippkaea orientalis PCC 8801]|uniref:DUF4340 domain-containing protein n=1 Tax=Rippkaea orientalis (strain PCC 8801 / RF-1) TaxID=41431 RepID=B7K0V4_RIPO1|nr:DUF4340 domain-containing protein [Rippkaea orientalis]ACK65095.1 conserved hypothetical protein [Rippkaea orientalis PCC 8801]
MQIKRTTWGLLVTAVFLSVGVYFYELTQQENQEQVQSQKEKIFDFSAETIQKITIETEKQSLQFERTKDPNKQWKMTQPKEAIANDPVVSFVINLLVTGESDRRFSIPANQKKEYGFEPPSAKLKIDLNNNTYHELILGKSDFKGEFLYAIIDPNIQNNSQIEISLVSQDFLSALDKKAEEWLEIKQPTQPSKSDKESNNN